MIRMEQSAIARAWKLAGKKALVSANPYYDFVGVTF